MLQHIKINNTPQLTAFLYFLILSPAILYFPGSFLSHPFNLLILTSIALALYQFELRKILKRTRASRAITKLATVTFVMIIPLGILHKDDSLTNNLMSQIGLRRDEAQIMMDDNYYQFARAVANETNFIITKEFGTNTIKPGPNCGKKFNQSLTEKNKALIAKILFTGIGDHTLIEINNCRMIIPSSSIKISYSSKND